MPRSKRRNIRVAPETKEDALTAQSIPDIITDISFEENLASIRETGVLFLPRRG